MIFTVLFFSEIHVIFKKPAVGIQLSRRDNCDLSSFSAIRPRLGAEYAVCDQYLACNEIPNILIPVTCSFLLKWLHLSNPTIGGIANFIPEISLQRFSAFFSQNKSSYLYKGNDHVIHFILIIWLFCNYRRAKARQDVLLIVCSFPSSFESIKQACPLSVMVCYHTRRSARKAFILYM